MQARCSGLDLDADELARNEEDSVDYSGDFFGREAFLTVSGQLNVGVRLRVV